MRDGKKVVITYGTYDLLHYGHTALFERAKELGDYLIVGVTSDAFDRERGKLNVHQSLGDRLEAVRATGIPDMVIVEEYQGQKVSDIRKYDVDVFAIGSDWEGQFDHLKKYCDVVYLPRTEGVSSTSLRARQATDVSLGCIGADYYVERFISECEHVASLNVVGVSPLEGQGKEYVDKLKALKPALEIATTSVELFDKVDAVYISASIEKRELLIRDALMRGCHVLCEGPLFRSREIGERLFALAKESGLVLMEAVKTLYCPAFEHLKLLLESGVIGEIKDVSASLSQVSDHIDESNVYEGSFYDLASYIMLPAISFLGPRYSDARLIASYEGDFCRWTKCELLYPSASATLSVGRNIKTEGHMVITGTKGYVYVPAPWWKTDYFEIRSEDLRDTKKFFYEYVGQGQRYEAFEFMRRINDGVNAYPPVQSEEDVLSVADLVEKFDKGDVIRLGDSGYRFGKGERVDDR